MQYGKYHFSITFQNEAILPPYKGSTFRGVFGHALKKVACAVKRDDCRDCLLQSKCLYAFVYETAAQPSVTGKTRVAAPPHPYVIDLPLDNKTHYQKGETFDFCLLLFGRANDFLPYFVHAFHEIGTLGIGKRCNGRRGVFSLRQVRTGNDIVYSCQDDRMDNGKYTEELTLDGASMRNDDREGTARITLHTPLRLKYRNSLEAKLPFHILTRAMLRRVSSLCNYHGEGEPALDYRGMVERAARVEIASSSLRWFDWKRYSNRQEIAMLMGGIIGSVTFRGHIKEFLPLLLFCEKVHLGKQTTFGLGKIGVDS